MKPRPPLHPIARLPEEWQQALIAQGERAFVARQVFSWIHKRSVFSPSEMTNLSASLRDKLTAEGLGPVAEVANVHRSADGTRKIVLKLVDGATIETVLLPGVTGPRPKLDADADKGADAADDDDDEDETADTMNTAKVRVTQCISTQVGCAMGCVFCASGVAGLQRHLGPEEIVAQVLIGRALCDEDEHLRNVVFMGMGEPLHNYEATARTLKLLSHRDGISLSTRRVTVSTSGLIPEIERLGKEFQGQVALAISLHATDDESRSALMPINRKYPLADLMAALRDYPLLPRRRITIEYTLVSGKNDTQQQAVRLSKLLRGIPVKINLIPMNPIEASTLGPPDMSRVLAFQQVLVDAGYSCFIRRRRGDDVSAACGQLALLGRKPKVKGFRSVESDKSTS